MLKEEIKELALELMNEWGLLEKGWTFIFIDSPNCLGRCIYRPKHIAFSSKFTQTPEWKIKDTLLHEIAHALAGYDAAHGPEWKNWAIKVGCIPEARSSEGVRDQLKWIIACPCCGRQSQRSRKAVKNTYSCSKCQVPIEWKLNHNYGF